MKIYHIYFSNIYLSKILVIYIYQSVNNCSENISYLSNLFDTQSVGTPLVNEWTGIAVLCCHGKK